MDSRVPWSGWDIVEPIGHGSFGTVYKISRDLFGELEHAALKVITIPQDSRDIEEMYNDGYDEESITSTFKSYLKSIVAEYALMRKMNGSANIVNCDDVQYIQHDDGIGWDIFIKMELLTPLVKALPNDIPEETVIKLAKDMCAALKLCKKFDIVHRDIKPQNIFVSPNGDFKLGDFGVAKTVEKTTGGTKVGTYKYMAPEVYNNQPYGSSADIYSLGLVLYWMLNHRRMPFVPLPPAKLAAGMEEEARMRRLSGEVLPEPANGSAALKRIVLKACAYDPKDRFHSAEEMLLALEGITQEPEDDRTVGVSFSRRRSPEPAHQEAEVSTPKIDTPPQKNPAQTSENSEETEYLFAGKKPHPKAEQKQAKEDNSPKDCNEQNQLTKPKQENDSPSADTQLTGQQSAVTQPEASNSQDDDSISELIPKMRKRLFILISITVLAFILLLFFLLSPDAGLSGAVHEPISTSTTSTRLDSDLSKNDAELTSVPTDNTPSLVSSGTYGDNLTWSLMTDGTLTIEGNDLINSKFINSLPFDSGDIKNIVIEKGVTSIGDQAFLRCSSLSQITIPDSVISIGDNAFSGCANLSEITIPDSVTYIDSWAFCGCANLSEITIPDRVTQIYDYAFVGCTSLSEITIPDSVTSIGDNAFSGCSNLSQVTIPDGVTSIGDNAFYRCINLSQITIPDGVTFIGYGTFQGCTSLSEITIPDSVTSIDDYAFSGCTSLTEVTIPASVTEISKDAFPEHTKIIYE